MVGIQIEIVQVVEEVDDIVVIDGVDFFFVGFFDLSQVFGVIGVFIDDCCFEVFD